VKVSLANHCTYLHVDLGARGNGNHLSRQRIVEDLAEKHMSQEGVGQHRVAIGIDLQIFGVWNVKKSGSTTIEVGRFLLDLRVTHPN